MKLKIAIELDGAAFGDTGAERLKEVEHILKDVFANVSGLEPGWTRPLRDNHGNKVGLAKVVA
jgi:hypothetical protein